MKAMLSASTYTDKIDIPFAKKAGRFRAQVAEICAMLTGIIMCLDYKAGQSLVEDRDFAQYKTDYQRIIEVRFPPIHESCCCDGRHLLHVPFFYLRLWAFRGRLLDDTKS